ncbi:hypothetical protein [Paenibacillus gorillae]|nr:hypothetical protein [Paenibacillus gorillae]
MEREAGEGLCYGAGGGGGLTLERSGFANLISEGDCGMGRE